MGGMILISGLLILVALAVLMLALGALRELERDIRAATRRAPSSLTRHHSYLKG